MSKDNVPDSEEDDSDYVEDEKGDDDESDEEQEEPEESLGKGISAHKRSKIDDLWASMNADDGSAVLRGGGDRASAKTTKTAKGNKGKQKALKKANKVLAGIFGKKTASSLVSKASKTKRRSTLAATKKEAADRAKELAASRTMEISEVKKYAGKDIVVKRTVTVGSAEQAAAAAQQKKAGLDSVLAVIDGPKSISTVTKSSLDWEKFKADEGIAGDMQQAVKDGKGYLNKQDFLQRCDVRKFENELEARQAKRNT
ncbi:unnamed protein product [Ascophyllum nodosum]